MTFHSILFLLHLEKDSWKTTLLLAYQSLGVVYGDLSISPLYVYKSTFAEDIQHSDTNEEIFGVLSFVFWTLTLVPLFKYVFIVLRADDNGEVSGLELSMSKEHHQCSEAMFADLGHFSYTAIQIAFTFLVYPALILAYMGQAAYLSKHHSTTYHISYYLSVPESVRWPVLGVAILASVVGSQAIISGTFSIINQSQSLGCFPRVKVVHTSDKIHGQIYIPEINWVLMVLCIAVTIGFRDTKHMGNASGAWLPILLALFLVTIMFVWHYATIKKYEYDLHNKVSLEWLLALGPSLGIARVPGIGLVFTDLTSGIPANFSRFVTNLPAFHRILVFVCVKSVPVPFVPPAERYLVGRVGPSAHRSYRCIVRYGYRDVHQDVDSFESELVNRLSDFIRYDWCRVHGVDSKNNDDDGSRSGGSSSDCRLAVIGTVAFSGTPAFEIEECVQPASVSVGFTTVESVTDIIEMEPIGAVERRVRFVVDDDSEADAQSETDIQLREELEDLFAAQQAGTAFILGNSYVKAKQGSSPWKRLAINFGYNFLRRNCRGADVALKVPPASLLEVGMVYVV
ncbi:hypothetical protein RJ639_018764 [Escallonia herrerae]|uniref:Potassium transporter n=1 Tax=Escallonia herrerae TaxID=1293975 RepID=A0AA89AKG7_9ASTE|nr:hypothetical protein RJ639_018764 [Escallonia herrerae]